MRVAGFAWLLQGRRVVALHGNAWLALAAISLTPSCERMASPPCPIDAAPLRIEAASQRTSAAYFKSGPVWQSSLALEVAAGDLVQYGEQPLTELALGGTSEAYRMLTTGPLGNMIAFYPDGGRLLRKTASRRLCEDASFGVTTCRSSRVLRQRDWRALSRCMEREFWNLGTPDDEPRVTLHGYVVACGPGGHESSCVVADLPLAVVEGVRNGHHLVRVFDSWAPSGRHSQLAACLDVQRAR